MNIKTRSPINGAVLKWIAVITMLIDHIGASCLSYYNRTAAATELSKTLYEYCRNIGRIAFPIFIFLLVEGYEHTRNKGKYLLRLLIFAAISDIPFDLAFRNSFFDLKSQNVFFTLSLGFMAICCMDHIQKNSPRHLKDPLTAFAFSSLLCIGITTVAVTAGYFLHVDYRVAGVPAIIVVWLLRKKPYLAMPLCIAILYFFSSHREIYAIPAIIPVYMYNGERGRQNKYFFYIFYPLHLTILGLITRFLIL